MIAVRAAVTGATTSPRCLRRHRMRPAPACYGQGHGHLPPVLALVGPAWVWHTRPRVR